MTNTNTSIINPSKPSAKLIALYAELYRLEFNRSVTSVNLLTERYNAPAKFDQAINNLIKRHLLSRSLADDYTNCYRQEMASA